MPDTPAPDQGPAITLRTWAAALAVLLTGVLIAVVPRLAADSPPGPERIMLLGDSLTQGTGGDITWRYHLWHHLERTHSPGVDFVGPYDGLRDPAGATPEDQVRTYRDPGFDTTHNALWNRTLSEATYTIGPDLDTHRTDTLMVMLGLNDLLVFEVEPHELESDLHTLVDNARDANDRLNVAVSTIPPTRRAADGDDTANRVESYNRRVHTTAEELTTADSPIAVVDIAEAADYVAEDHTYDGVRPNTKGELRIAATVADTLADDLDLGEPYPRPLPTDTDELQEGLP